MVQALPTTAPKVDRIRSHIAEQAAEAGVPFDWALRQYARHALLGRLQQLDAPSWMRIGGGNALVAHLGPEHRKIELLELIVQPASGLERASKLLSMEVVDDRAFSDGLSLNLAPPGQRRLERGETPTREFVVGVALGTAETSVRLRLEELELGAFVQVTELCAPLGLLEPVPFTAAVPAMVFADAVERVVRRDALRMPMAPLLDAWLCVQTDPLEDLDTAISAVFDARGTPTPSEGPYTLSDACAARYHAQRQWEAFVGRNAPDTPVGLDEVVEAIRETAMSVFGDLMKAEETWG